MINLPKAREGMQRLGIQGLLLCSPENFLYAAGYTPMLLDLYRQAPLSLCFLPADEKLPPAMFVPETDQTLAQNSIENAVIYTFPVWWELYQVKPHLEKQADLHRFLSAKTRSLPPQYDTPYIAARTAEYFQQHGLEKARVGLEFDFISHAVFDAFSQANPAISFTDSSPLLYQLRSIKTAQEVEYLEKVCMLTEAGIARSSQAITVGASIGDLNYAFQIGVLEYAREMALLDLLGEIGGQPALGPAGELHENHITSNTSTTVKYDMQVSLAHYHSDVGRTYVAGRPTGEQIRLYQGLLEAHHHLVKAICPGTKISEVYQAGRDSLERAGLGRLSRGHFGHSVGLDNKIEEPPFISQTETSALEPGMVLAVETPCYFEGIGKFQIEDMVLVTKTGARVFNTLPKDWPSEFAG